MPLSPRVLGCVVALVGVLCSQPDARAQGEPLPQGVSRGENFSAKPPAQLFASDCTGSGCHKSPQGLVRTQGFSSLAGFLREHYTNSRESAAALANYLSKLPSAPEPRNARSGKPAPAATASGGPGWLEGGETRPAPNESRASRQNGRTSRATAKPDDEPVAATHQQPVIEPGDAAKPDAASRPSARERRGRQPATAAATPPAAPPEPEAAAVPPPAPAAPPPAPKQYDIFD